MVARRDSCAVAKCSLLLTRFLSSLRHTRISRQTHIPTGKLALFFRDKRIFPHEATPWWGIGLLQQRASEASSCTPSPLKASTYMQRNITQETPTEYTASIKRRATTCLCFNRLSGSRSSVFRRGPLILSWLVPSPSPLVAVGRGVVSGSIQEGFKIP